MSTCGADTDANDLLTSLTASDDFTVPSVDLNDSLYSLPLTQSSAIYNKVEVLTAAEFTEKSVTGSGVFDVFMAGAAAQLKAEYQSNRITGAEYTKAFIATIEAVLSSSLQFLLGKDQAFWQAQRAQIDAINGIVNLESSKVQYATLQLQAKTVRAEYALNKMRLATADMEFCTSKYNLENMLPTQLAQVEAQTDLITSQKAVQDYQVSSVLPADIAQTNAQTALLGSQKLQTAAQTNLLDSQKTVEDLQAASVIPSQVAQTQAQTALLGSQKGVQDYQLSDILPSEKAQTIAQTALITSQKTAEDYQVSDILPASKAQTLAQTDMIESQKTGQDYQNANLLPAQVEQEAAQTAFLASQKTGQDYQNSTLLPDQHSLLQEQIDVQHAQTHDTNLDGSSVTGVLGAQKSLYNQQVQSYMRDAEVKAVKLWMDGWSVMRTTDEGLTPPTSMSNDNINTLLNGLMSKNGFVS